MNNTINSQLRNGSATAQYSDQFERGHSFSWRGKWTAGVRYFCNNEVTDFVTCDNTILVCRQTHTADGSNRPVIIGSDVEGNLWEIALQNDGGQAAGCCEEMGERLGIIANKISDLNDRLSEIRDKMNVQPQPTTSYALKLTADHSEITTTESAHITATLMTFIDGIHEVDLDRDVTDFANWTSTGGTIVDGEFSCNVQGNYTINCNYTDLNKGIDETSSIRINVSEQIIPDSITLSESSKTFSYSGQVDSVTLTSNCDWAINVDDPSWISVVPDHGTAISGSRIRIGVSDNGYSERNGNVIFYGGNASATLRVVQSARPEPTITVQNITLTSNVLSGSTNVTIHTEDPNGHLSISEVSDPSGVFNATLNGTTVNVTVSSANTGTSARSASYLLTYTYDNNKTKTANLTVSQSAPVVSNTIYYGFGPSAEWVYQNGSHKDYAVNNVYSGTAPEEDYHFYVIVPYSLVSGAEDVSFTDGGLGCVMHSNNVTLGGKQYVAYYLAALQQPGTIVKLKMSIDS